MPEEMTQERYDMIHDFRFSWRSYATSKTYKGQIRFTNLELDIYDTTQNFAIEVRDLRHHAQFQAMMAKKLEEMQPMFTTAKSKGLNLPEPYNKPCNLTR